MASQVAGGENKGEVRYCFCFGDKKYVSKDCPKKGDLKCVAHLTATSHERLSSKERHKDPHHLPQVEHHHPLVAHKILFLLRVKVTWTEQRYIPQIVVIMRHTVVTRLNFWMVLLVLTYRNITPMNQQSKGVEPQHIPPDLLDH